MLKRFLSLLLIASLTTGISTSLREFTASANTVESEVSEVAIEGNAQYLSNFTNLRKNVGHREMTIDKDTDGNALHLRVEGEIVRFDKGIYGHANSDIIYDISNRAEGFNRFVTRMGLNQNGNTARSNGVVFTIQTSTDRKTWTPVEGYENVISKPADNSIYVDFKLTEDVKYIRLIASTNGEKTCDSATYADAKLVTENYKESDLYDSAILKTQEYDKELNKKSIDENLKDVTTIYKREFVDKFGYYNLQNFYSKSQNHKNMINYIFGTEEVIKMFIEIGDLNASESPATVLDNFYAIYDKHRYDFINKNYLKLAIATSFAGGSNIVFWAGGKAQDVVERYNIYKDFITDTKSAWSWTTEERNQFNSLPIAMMKYTVDTRQNNDEIKWFADYVKNTKNKSLNAYDYVEYKGVKPFNNPAYYGTNAAKYIEKYKMGKYNINTEDPNTIRWYAVMEIDGVCGALAKTYAGLRETFGYPAGVVHQPGHAATILYDGTKWQLSNDVFGWAQSRDEMGQMPLNWGMKSWNSDRSASYVFLTQNVLDNDASYTKATLINILAEAKAEAGDFNGAQETYRKALEVQPNNLDSMYGLIQAYLSDNSKSEADYLALQKDIADKFKLYPFPMLDLMKLIEGKITGGNVVIFDLVKNEALADAADTTQDEHIQHKEIVNIVNAIMGKNKVDMASFSFDGENAGKIVMNEKYSASEIVVEYSLNGGDTWIATDKQVIELTEAQIKSINAKDDIKVRLVGANNNIFTIDIKEGAKPTGKINDLENFILGDVSHLQFFNTSTNKWVDYKAGGYFTGNVELKVRNKAFGTTLQSEEGILKFTANESSKERSYIKISESEVLGASSYNGSAKPENALDGDVSTTWHNTYAGEKDKWISFKFNEAKNLHSFDFSVGSFNGIMEQADIYISQDGKEWTKVDTVKGVRQKATQTVKFTKPIKTQYLKIQATKTSGNNDAEVNKYFSVLNIDFYEVAK